LSIWFQILIFGITGLLIYLGVFYGVPGLAKRGVPVVYSFFGFLWTPVILLFPLSLYLFAAVEGGVISVGAVAERFRFVPINGQDWLWIGGAVLLTVFSEQALEPIGKYFAKKKAFAPPGYLPAPFNPLKTFTFPPREFFGVKLKGNWKLLVLFVFFHSIAMFIEEMMWRGYLLPLQEAVFGNLAWVINGMLWAWLVHAVLKWHFIGMIPGMLAAPFIAQHTQSTWASFIVHAVPNALLWVLLLVGVLDLGKKVDRGGKEEIKK